jgi:hypothetical protein
LKLIPPLVTEGEENLEDIEDDVKSSKHEAKKMAIRITETMQSMDDQVPLNQSRI